MDMSKRLDDAMRRVMELPQSYQERAIIRLQTLIREWENTPNHEREETMHRRIRHKLKVVRKLFKRNQAVAVKVER